MCISGQLRIKDEFFRVAARPYPSTTGKTSVSHYLFALWGPLHFRNKEGFLGRLWPGMSAPLFGNDCGWLDNVFPTALLKVLAGIE